ncbi:MAG: hypothetical protein QXW83_01890 [Nitrososphaerales archaeon]
MKPRDRDFIKTKEGFFFCAIGYTHPKDRIISYIKYVPKEGGKWAGKYDRVMPSYTMLNLLKNLYNLKEYYPHYVYNSKVFNTMISAVPYNYIKHYYHPDRKIQQLLRKEKKDRIQEATVNLVEYLSKEAKVPIVNFGITGSILINIHHPILSDIDIIVYGYKNALKVKEAIIQLYNEDRLIHRLSSKRLEEWCKDKASTYPLTINEAKGIYNRKWNYGIFEDYNFSIHPVKLNNEIFEEYGDTLYIPKGMIQIEGEISDTSQSLFLPHTYHVKNISIKEGLKVNDIKEVSSYESLYGDIMKLGERFIAYGKLEKVVNVKSGEEYHRVLIGSLEAGGKDYIKPKYL